MLLWLWCRSPAAALFQLLAWELPYVVHAALEKSREKKKKKREREKERNVSYLYLLLYIRVYNQVGELKCAWTSFFMESV